MIRILVTGSRDWDDKTAVFTAIEDYLLGVREDDKITIVQGECPTGADFYARAWARGNGAQVESHPADWEQYGRYAGPVRNREMVKSGADVCLAFQLNGSRGTQNAIELAVRAGMTVHLYEQGES